MSPRSVLTVRDPAEAYPRRMHSSNGIDLGLARALPSAVGGPGDRSGGAEPSWTSGGGARTGEAFLDILSHELRTPVTTIYAGAQILATRELSSELRYALAADVRSEADRLYRLVEDLVILARSERDEIRPVGEPVAVRHLVVAAIEREVARHPESQILLLGPNDASADESDEGMVTHVIRNLLDNAIRYGGQAGPIEVLIDVTAAEVIVRVIDRGPQAEAPASAPGSGTIAAVTAAGRAGAGIGLYVAERLVKAMRGRMWSGKSDAHGNEFGFALARSEAARQAGDV